MTKGKSENLKKKIVMAPKLSMTGMVMKSRM